MEDNPGYVTNEMEEKYQNLKLEVSRLLSVSIFLDSVHRQSC